VTVVVPSGNTEPLAGLYDSTGVDTASVAVAGVKLTVAPAELVASKAWSAGGVTTGAVVSLTVTRKAAVELLPAPSVAVTVTVVMPSGNTEPLAGLYDSVGVDTASVAVAGVKLTVAPDALVASKAWSAGGVTTGAVVSLTVTRKVAVELLPAPS